LEPAQAYFDDKQHFKDISALCSFTHPKAGSKTFPSLKSLRNFIQKEHQLQFCDVCLEHRKVFISEQELYSKSSLERHLRQGDTKGSLAATTFKGHPFCKWCKAYYYGENEIYQHMHSSHEECFLCRRAYPGKYEYYRDYNQLEEHFSIKHYPCMHQICRERKFVVFSTETDLKKHTAKEHGDTMSKAERKQALQLPVNFTYSSSNGGGGGGGSSSSSSLAAGMAGITIGGGPPSVPSRYGRRGGSGNSSNNGGRGDVRIIDEQQQQQQQQQQQALLLSAAATQRGQRDVDLDPSDFPAGGLASSSSSSMIGGGGGGRWAAATGGGNGGGLRPEEFPSLPGSSKSAKKRANMKKKSLAESLRGATRGGGGVRVVSTAGSRGNSFPPLRPSSSSNSGDGHTDSPGYNNNSGTGHQQKQQHQMTRAPSSQEIAGPSTSLSSTASVSQGLRQANVALVQQIKSKLNASEFQQFRDISSSWLKGSVSSNEYHSVIMTLGLVEVVPDLAATCPDAEKRRELLGIHKVAFLKTSNNINNNNNNGSSNTSGKTSGWVPPEVAAVAAERAERYSSWTCSLCTLANGPGGRVCEACGTAAPQPGDESNHWRREKNEGEGGGGGGGGGVARTPAASSGGDAFPSLPIAPLPSSSSSSGITFITAAGNEKGKGKQKLSYGEFVSRTKVHPQNVWRNPNLKGKWSKNGALAQEERALKDAWGKK
jgi:E3 ubiquitin-protein ligase ZNF598